MADFLEPNLERADVFDRAWLAAQPPDVRALVTSGLSYSSQERKDKATALVLAGHQINWPVVVDGNSPYHLFRVLRQLGYTWIPNVGQKFGGVLLPPGFPATSGYVAYDASTVPPGAIKIPDPDTCDIAAEYPPFEGLPVVPPKVLDKVGKPVNGMPNWYECTPDGWADPNGAPWQEDGMSFVKLVYNQFGGMPAHYWIRQL